MTEHSLGMCAPETPDERQAAIVAALRASAEYGQDAPVHQMADWIESGEWRPAWPSA